MKRVCDTSYDPSVNDVLYFLFSPVKPLMKRDNLFHIEWDIKTKTYSSEFKGEIQKSIIKYLKEAVIQCVIGDCFTLPYFEFLDCNMIYDTHSLSLPLNEVLDRDRRYLTLDKFTTYPLNSSFLLQFKKYMKFEYFWMGKCTAFISNSTNTTKYLNTHYRGLVEGKKIFDVPVVSSLDFRESIGAQGEKLYPFYCFSRWHPQKGYFFLLNHDWSEKNLYIRGISKGLISESTKKDFSKKGIFFLDWTESSDEILVDLANADIALFPAIYEPYGLSLAEAMKAGTLVVAHDNNSGHNEQVTHGKDGFLLDFSDANFITELKNISNLSDSNKREIKTNATCSSKLSLEKRLNKLKEVFNYIYESWS